MLLDLRNRKVLIVAYEKWKLYVGAIITDICIVI